VTTTTKTTTVRAIRIADLSDELRGEELLSAVAMAMEELCLVQALILIHGHERGVERYVEAGGHVRFDDEREPVLLWAGPRS
jgi:hypothetical protein